nr:hypothetical protein [Candidatus Sigynarchaeota archaeon]
MAEHDNEGKFESVLKVLSRLSILTEITLFALGIWIVFFDLVWDSNGNSVMNINIEDFIRDVILFVILVIISVFLDKARMKLSYIQLLIRNHK